MFFTILKILITAGIIVIASEIAKRSSLLAGLIVSMPLITVLTLIWLYWDTRDTQQVTDLTYNTLLMILPSLTFFIFLPIALKLGMNFVPAITIAIIGTAIAYWCYTLILFKFFNISL